MMTILKNLWSAGKSKRKHKRLLMKKPDQEIVEDLITNIEHHMPTNQSE